MTELKGLDEGESMQRGPTVHKHVISLMPKKHSSAFCSISLIIQQTTCFVFSCETQKIKSIKTCFKYNPNNSRQYPSPKIEYLIFFIN